MSKELITHDKMSEYLSQGWTLERMAAHEKTSIRRIKKSLAHHNLVYQKHSYQKAARKLQLENYIEQGMSGSDIARIEGIGINTVSRHIRYHKLKSYITQRVEKIAQTRVSISSIELDRLATEGWTLKQIAAKYDMPVNAIKNMCDKFGIRTKKAKQYDNASTIEKTHVEQLVSAGLSILEISRNLGIATPTVRSLLKEYGLQVARHGWTCSKRSPPCEYLKAQLNSANLEFEAEWRPLRSRLFRLDVAFPSIKIALEVNGNFHYVDVEKEILTPYYQHRHDLLCSAGWTVVEVPYLKVWDTCYVEKLVAWIRESKRVDRGGFMGVKVAESEASAQREPRVAQP